MIYRVHLIDADGSRGFIYVGSAKEAESHMRDWAADPPACGGAKSELSHADVPTSEAEVLALLNKWASHPNNG